MTLSAIARAAVWFVAAAFFAWSTWGLTAAVGASVGATSGVLLCAPMAPRFGPIRLPAALVVFVTAFVLAVFLPHLAALLGQFGVSLALSNALPSFWIAFGVAWCVVTAAARYEGLRFAEPCAVAVGLAWPFLPASGGNHIRPQWFSDLALEHGFVLTDVLSWAGWLGAALCLVVLLLPTPSSPSISSLARRLALSFGGAAIIVVAVGSGWLVSNHLAPVAAAPTTLPPPPISFVDDPPPPPAPEPLPVAAVQLAEAYVPPPRLAAFFFRAPDLLPDDSVFVSDKMDALQIRVVDAKVYYLDEKAAPLALAGSSWVADFPPPGLRFKKAQTFRSLLPKQSDFSLSSIGDLLRLELMEPVANPQPVDARLLPILSDIESVMSGKLAAPPESRLAGLASSSRAAREWISSPSLQATAIVAWLEQNGEFSEKSTVPEDPVQFFEAGLKGGPRHFANLAVVLMRAKGIRSRVAEGYVVAAEKEPTDRIVITDGHSDSWPELQLANGHWIPMPVRPRRIFDRNEPPPREDVKDELFAAINSKQPVGDAASPHFEAPKSTALAAYMFMGVASAASAAVLLGSVIFIFIPSARISAALDSNRHRVALNEAAKLASRLFRPRQFGESWRHFASSVGQEFPRAGLALGRLLQVHASADDGHIPPQSWPVLFRNAALQMILARIQPCRRRKQST
jgi:hypothetical protein